MSVTRFISVTAALVVAGAPLLTAQQPPAQPPGRVTPRTGPAVAKLVASPEKIIMKAGETVPLKVTAYDDHGKVIADAMVRVMGARQAFTWSDGQLHATKAGTFTAVAIAFGGAGQPATIDIPLTITWPALNDLNIAQQGRLYTDVTLGQSLSGHLPDSSVH
jgi:hypothetical protein